MLDIGYALSTRFPDPPAGDYRRADVHALRYDLFCGDVYLADTATDRELSTAWGWVPVLDFAWALCDIAERLGAAPRSAPAADSTRAAESAPAGASARAAESRWAELDFTESTERMRFAWHSGVPARTSPGTARHVSSAPAAGPVKAAREPSRQRGWVTIEADWTPAGEPPLAFPLAELRRESRDFLHDLLADLIDLHEDLGDNPAVWQLQARFPRV